MRYGDRAGLVGLPVRACYSLWAMPFSWRFGLYDSTLRSWRRLWNLLVSSLAYLAAVVALGVLLWVSGGLMGWVGDLLGIDQKTQFFLAAAVKAIFVALIAVSLTHAIGDAAKLVWYYVRDWRIDDEQPGAGREDEGT